MEINQTSVRSKGDRRPNFLSLILTRPGSGHTGYPKTDMDIVFPIMIYCRLLTLFELFKFDKLTSDARTKTKRYSHVVRLP